MTKASDSKQGEFRKTSEEYELLIEDVKFHVTFEGKNISITYKQDGQYQTLFYDDFKNLQMIIAVLEKVAHFYKLHNEIPF